MSSTSSTVRDTVRDAKDAVSETRKAASAASGDIQEDLQALRDDVTKLASQIGDILAAKGNQAWERAKNNASAKGQEAVDAVREVSDNMVGAIDESLKKRPYTTLAIAVGIGFLLGITRR